MVGMNPMMSNAGNAAHTAGVAGGMPGGMGMNTHLGNMHPGQNPNMNMNMPANHNMGQNINTGMGMGMPNTMPSQNLPNGIMPRRPGDFAHAANATFNATLAANGEEANYEARLNFWIYGYFLERGQWDLARAVKNSTLPFLPPIEHPESAGSRNNSNKKNVGTDNGERKSSHDDGSEDADAEKGIKRRTSNATHTGARAGGSNNGHATSDSDKGGKKNTSTGDADNDEDVKIDHMADPLKKVKSNSSDDDNTLRNHTSTKDIDAGRPDDLPNPKAARDESGGSMLLGWFSLFWDMYAAQRRMAEASRGANQLIEQSRMHRQGRESQIARTMSAMMPAATAADGQQLSMPLQAPMQAGMMRMNAGDLRQRTLAQSQQAAAGMKGPMNPQQMMQLQRNFMLQQQQQMVAQQQQNQMRRDPSSMDMNGQRPRTPGSSDHVPSPSKRPRMDGTPMHPHAMMMQQQHQQQQQPPQSQQAMQQQQQQGAVPRPGSAVPPGMVADTPQARANAILLQHGINPASLTEAQYLTFQQQNPVAQAKAVQIFSQNLHMKQQEGGMDGSMNNQSMQGDPSQMMRNNALQANGVANPGAGNHALQDYQMQLMLLEQQNKKRLLMARMEHELLGQGIPGGSFTGMSPQASRGGPSPGPGGDRRETPKMPQQGLPGSPMPDGGGIRSSPGAMFHGMPPDMLAANGLRPPMPNSNPNAFNPNNNNMPFNAQQMELMRQRMANGAWQGGQGPGMIGQPGMIPSAQAQPGPGFSQVQGQIPAASTPQQRNDMMPPPHGPGPGPGAGLGRVNTDDNSNNANSNGVVSNTAITGNPTPPTAQPGGKANSKPTKKKADSKAKGNKSKANSASVAATPVPEAENPSQTPAPSTPMTPSHGGTFENTASSMSHPASGSFGSGNNNNNLGASSNNKPEDTPGSNAGVSSAASGGQAPAPSASISGASGHNGAPAGGAFQGVDGSSSLSSEDETDQSQGDPTSANESYNMNFNSDLVNTTDVLDNFDFDQFLETAAFNFDANQFDGGDMNETSVNEPG